MRPFQRVVSAMAILIVIVSGALTTAGPASAVSAPPSFAFKTYAKGIKFTWSGASGAVGYQLKVRKTSQSSTSGTVFSLPSSRRSFRLNKHNFPAYSSSGGYRFKLCAVGSGGTRSCVSQSLAVNRTGTRVRVYDTTTSAKRGAAKANHCLDNAADAVVITAAGTAVVNFVPGAGQVTYGTVLAITTGTAAATYVMCVWRGTSDTFVTDDYRYVTSTTGSWSGGGFGGGGGGGGSWRL